MLYVNQNKLEHMLKLVHHNEVVNTILKVVDTKLFDVVRNDKMGWTSITAKGGGVRPALCVHTDTVGNTHPEMLQKDGDIWRNADKSKLLGADDRAGCYIVKELLTRNHTGYHYLIFDWEEVGGIGSSNYARTDTALTDVKRISCFIGLDRLGLAEMALYGYESPTFMNAMEIEHWNFEYGSFTDASNLAGDLNRCCVNMSVGYNNEHTRHEILNLSHLSVTLNTLANGLCGLLYEDVFIPCKDYDGFENEYYGDDTEVYTLLNGRDSLVPVSDIDDETYDILKDPNYYILSKGM